MGLFDSKSKTDQSVDQTGTEGSGQAVTASGKSQVAINNTYINEFPDAFQEFANRTLDLVGSAQSRALSTTGDLASKTQAPITQYIPIIAIIGGVVATVMIWGRDR